jgi:hypothetical protein
VIDRPARPRISRLRRLWVCCAGICVVAAVAPTPATAHVSPGLISTGFEARIARGLPGIAAHVLDGDQRLQLTVAPGHVAIVRGIEGEPMLRFGRGGVIAKSRSPTATAAGVITAGQARGAARWIRVTGGRTLAWHENRLRPLPFPHRTGRVARWRVPMVVDGHATALTGWEWHAAPPSRLLWSILAIIPVCAAALMLALRRPRPEPAAATVAAVVAVAAWGGGWVGVLLYGRLTTLWIGVAVLYGLSLGALMLAAVTEPKSAQTRMLMVGMMGLFAATFSLPELGVFQRGFVLSALPEAAARICVALGVGMGVAAGLLAIPAARQVFRGDN